MYRHVLAAFAAFLMPLPAAIVISSGPTNFAGDENVLFNQAGLTLVGTVVEGVTNNTGSIVEFRDAGESLTGNGGQARVEGTDGLLTALTIVPQLANFTFKTLVLNINANEDGEVTFTVTPESGPVEIQTFSVSGNGQNFFGFEGTAGTRLRSVSLVLSNPDINSSAVVAADDVRQIRIGGIGDSAVPEPGTYLLTAAGLLGLGMLRRRR
jgi:PEP-CTERM motif